MEISNDTREFADKLVEKMIKEGMIKSENDLTEEMIDEIIEAIKPQVKKIELMR